MYTATWLLAWQSPTCSLSISLPCFRNRFIRSYIPYTAYFPYHSLFKVGESCSLPLRHNSRGALPSNCQGGREAGWYQQNCVFMNLFLGGSSFLFPCFLMPTYFPFPAFSVDPPKKRSFASSPLVEEREEGASASASASASAEATEKKYLMYVRYFPAAS